MLNPTLGQNTLKACRATTAYKVVVAKPVQAFLHVGEKTRKLLFKLAYMLLLVKCFHIKMLDLTLRGVSLNVAS